MKTLHFLFLLFFLWSSVNCFAQKEKTDLPVAKFSDAKMEQAMLECYKTKGWKEQATKAIIISDWYYVKHPDTGIILRRVIDAVLILRKNDKCILQPFSFEQEAIEGNKYANFSDNPAYGYPKKISCECLNK